MCPRSTGTIATGMWTWSRNLLWPTENWLKCCCTRKWRSIWSGNAWTRHSLFSSRRLAGCPPPRWPYARCHPMIRRPWSRHSWVSSKKNAWLVFTSTFRVSIHKIKTLGLILTCRLSLCRSCFRSIHWRRTRSISWVMQLPCTTMISTCMSQPLTPSKVCNFILIRLEDTVQVPSCTQFTVSADCLKLSLGCAPSTVVPTCSTPTVMKSSSMTLAKLLELRAVIKRPRRLLSFVIQPMRLTKCSSQVTLLSERFAYWIILSQKRTMHRVFRSSCPPNNLKGIMVSENRL